MNPTADRVIADLADARNKLESANAKLQAEVDRLKAENCWIPVGERLPEKDTYVLWCYESGGMLWGDIPHDADTVWISRFLSGYHNSGYITHWRPITLPKGE